MEYSADDPVKSRAACGSKRLAVRQSRDLHVVEGFQVLDWIATVRNSPISLIVGFFDYIQPDVNIRKQ